MQKFETRSVNVLLDRERERERKRKKDERQSEWKQRKPGINGEAVFPLRSSCVIQYLGSLLSFLSQIRDYVVCIIQ